MSIPNDLLKKKTMGIIQSIEKMTDKERGVPPSKKYGEDYNQLRNFVIASNPELEPVMPPRVDTLTDPIYPDRTVQTFAEIHTFCSQIYQLLP